MFPNENTAYVARVADQPSSTGSLIYNTIYRELGLNALYLQMNSIPAMELATGIRSLRLRGCTVVGVNARDVLPFLDTLDVHAERAGAVNTIVNDSGRLIGYKTDGPALLDALAGATALKGKDIVVLGAGKLVKELGLVLDGTGVRSVTIYNRNKEKGLDRCRETGFSYGGEIQHLTDAAGDIFVNASDVGAAWCKVSDLFPLPFIDRFEVIMDVTFKPTTTSLQENAASLGKIVVPGVQMFALQGKRQIDLYFGAKASETRLRELIRKEFEGA